MLAVGEGYAVGCPDISKARLRACCACSKWGICRGIVLRFGKGMLCLKSVRQGVVLLLSILTFSVEVRWCWVNFQYRGVLLIWIIVGQGPTALWDGLNNFSLVYHFSLLSPSDRETSR